MFCNISNYTNVQMNQDYKKKFEYRVPRRYFVVASDNVRLNSKCFIKRVCANLPGTVLPLIPPRHSRFHKSNSSLAVEKKALLGIAPKRRGAARKPPRTDLRIIYPARGETSALKEGLS